MQITDTLTFRALSAILTQCDGARSDDSKGFSGYDAGFVRDLIAKGSRLGWSERQYAAAKKLAHKYRKQAGALLGESFDLNALAAEAAPVREPRAAEPDVTVEAKCCGASPKALRLTLRDGRTLWCPRSVIRDMPEGFTMNPSPWAPIAIAPWFGKKEGLATLRAGKEG